MLDRSLQPPLYIEKYPRDIGVMSNRLQDQFPIEIVKAATGGLFELPLGWWKVSPQHNTATSGIEKPLISRSITQS